MTIDTMPDVEGALRTWLRTKTDLTDLVGQRIFFGVPKEARESSFPMVTLRRVGGGDDTSDAPVDLALIQLDVWGSLDDHGHGDKATTTTIVNTLRAVLRSIDRTTLTGTTVAHIATVESVVWLPDPDNDRPRYTVTAEVAAVTS